MVIGYLLHTGAECYSAYTGYASTFEWAGNHHDETPYDEYGRRRTSILAIDALLYHNTAVQFRPSKVIRELNKVYTCDNCTYARICIYW